jgi:hypothetical protein
MVEAPNTHPFEIYVGSLAAMEMVAFRGVKGLNPDTHRWQVVSKTATYQVIKDFEVADEETDEKFWCASLFCDQDLRTIANGKSLIIP